jgi:hypothetical protein
MSRLTLMAPACLPGGKSPRTTSISPRHERGMTRSSSESTLAAASASHPPDVRHDASDSRGDREGTTTVCRSLRSWLERWLERSVRGAACGGCSRRQGRASGAEARATGPCCCNLCASNADRHGLVVLRGRVAGHSSRHTARQHVRGCRRRGCGARAHARDGGQAAWPTPIPYAHATPEHDRIGVDPLATAGPLTARQRPSPRT